MLGVVRGLSGLRGLFVVALVVSDLIMLRLAFVLAYRMRLLGDTRPGQPSDPPSTYDELALLCVLVIMLVFRPQGLIPSRQRAVELTAMTDHGEGDVTVQGGAADLEAWRASLQVGGLRYYRAPGVRRVCRLPQAAAV